MKPKVDQLVIELTRRCNMCCPHCLRGRAQDLDIEFETVKKILNSFSNIWSITFSGGEPTLCEDLLEKIVDYIIAEEIPVNGFYMASNGKKISWKIMFSLAKLYGYVYAREGMLDDYQCIFDISLDQYHEKISKENIGMLKVFSFVSNRGEIPPGGVISEGNAKTNGIGYRNLNHQKKFYLSDEDEEYGNLYDLVYVNAKGNILPDCDFSYETQDSLPNVSIMSDKGFDVLAEQYNNLIYC